MIMASSVNFGLRRSLPHLLGICIGFSVMLFLVGLGLHTVLSTYPIVLQVMRYAGALYLLWLAWKLASAHAGSTELIAPAKPLSFLGASAFQWVNPKAWVMAMTTMTTYLPDGAGLGQVLMLSSLMTVVGSPCVAVWAAFGSAMRGYLQDPKRLRLFNRLMAAALVASLYPLLYS
jgi:threonine/homoserine/homoserine lactone efflux protein